MSISGIIAFTGHRPPAFPHPQPYDQNNPYRMACIQAIKEQLQLLKPRLCISGMALGVDTWAAEACLQLGAPFHAYIPFRGQESRWPAVSQGHYRFLLEQATQIIEVSRPGYAAWKMQRRNEAMSDSCDILLGCWMGTPGGTGNCVRYHLATWPKKPFTNVWPRVRELVQATGT